VISIVVCCSFKIYNMFNFKLAYRFSCLCLSFFSDHYDGVSRGVYMWWWS